jgi:hypothetical protein
MAKAARKKAVQPETPAPVSLMERLAALQREFEREVRERAKEKT